MRISDWSSDVCSSDLTRWPTTRSPFAGALVGIVRPLTAPPPSKQQPFPQEQPHPNTPAGNEQTQPPSPRLPFDRPASQGECGAPRDTSALNGQLGLVDRVHVIAIVPRRPDRCRGTPRGWAVLREGICLHIFSDPEVCFKGGWT